MNNCSEFLKWALPHINRRWEGYKKVKKQVCSRIQKRIEVLNLSGYQEYSEFLLSHKEEWGQLDEYCQITISRFFRDRMVFEWIKTDVVPDFIESNRNVIKCWCIGAASGEEPYSLSILFHETHLLDWEIIATDISDYMLQRAKKGCYQSSSLKEVSQERLIRAFDKVGDRFCLKTDYKENVRFFNHDIRIDAPDYIFDLVLCRNTVAIYFDLKVQIEIFTRIFRQMRPNSYLVLGTHEVLPDIFLEKKMASSISHGSPIYVKNQVSP
jgi:chemotaxis protein methyltransferase CheR